MKTLILCLFISSTCYSQSKAYGKFGFMGYISPEHENMMGASVGAGVIPATHFSAGVAVDLIFLKDIKPKNVLVFFDFRYLAKEVNEKPTGFLSVQPGFNIANVEGIDFHGKFSYGILGGIISKPKGKIGFQLMAGFLNIGYKIGELKKNYGGFKIDLGVTL